MDPALWEMLDGNNEDEVEAIIRLKDQESIPDGVRIVSKFGPVATCRLRRGDIRKVWADDTVESLKAGRPIEAEVLFDSSEEYSHKEAYFADDDL